MAEKYHNLATVTSALDDEEERKKLTGQDFLQMDYVLSKVPADEKKLAQEKLLNAVKSYIQNLANTDLSFFSLNDIKASEACSYFSNQIPDDVKNDLQQLMQKIETRRQEIKTQTLDSVKNNPQNLSPADLWKLRENLTLLPPETETATAAKKLEDVIIAKVQELTENKTVILDMHQAYLIRDMLEEIAAHPLSDNKDANAPIIKSAQEILKDQIETFEESYGIKKPLLDEAIVQRNLEALGNMPSDEELFSYNEAELKLAPAIDLMDIRGAIHDADKDGRTLPVPMLVGVLQDKSLDLPQFDSDRKILLEMALKHVKETDVSKLQPKDFANFGLLIEKLQESDKYKDKTKLLEKKHKALLAARQSVRSAPKHPEFASVIGVLDNLQIEGNLTLLGREQIDQITKDSDIALFRDRIRQETEMFLANTSKEEITEDVFKETYNERLKLGIVEIVYADRISKGEVDKKNTEQMLKLFDKLNDEAKAGKPIKLNLTTLVGWHAVHDNRSTTAANRVVDAGHKQTGKTFLSKIKDFDTKCTQKYPTLYPLLKNGLKSAGWGTAYGIGSAFGPAGIAAVASASFAYSGYKFFNGFWKARKEAKAEGKKLGFWQYLNSHKMQAAGMLLSAGSAVVGLGGMTGLEGLSDGSVLQSTFQMARAPAGIALAASGAINQASKAFAKKGENDERSFGKRLWDGTKAFGLSAVSFGVGMAAGRLGGMAGVTAYQNHFGNNDMPVPETPAQQPASVQQPAPNMQPSQNLFTNSLNWNFQQNENGFGFTNIFGDNPLTNNETDLNSETSAAQIDANPATPAIDVNDLTTEQQHDLKMLFLRDPAKANELIGDGKWHSSAELEKMWNATGKNALSDEVKLNLVQFADTRFDEKGNFINSDGSIDTNAETAAKEWQAEHDVAHRGPASEIHHFEPLSPEALKPQMPHLDIEIKMPDPEQLQLNIHDGIARSLGVQTIERLDNGNIVTERITPQGRHYTSEISPDAKFVSLTIEGKEFSQERLDALNNPDKNLHSSILDQNRQLFIIAPAIGEEVRDFTQPAQPDATTVSAENDTSNIVKEQTLSDSEQSRTTTGENTPKQPISEHTENSNNSEDTIKSAEQSAQENQHTSTRTSAGKIDMDIPDSGSSSSSTDSSSDDDKDKADEDTTETHTDGTKPEENTQDGNTGSDNQNTNMPQDKIDALRRGVYLGDKVAGGTVSLDITHDITLNDAKGMCADHITKISGFENAEFGGGGGTSGSINGHSVYSFGGIYSQSDGNNTNIALVDCNKGITSARYFSTTEDGRSHFMMDTQDGPAEMTYAQAKHFVQNVEQYSIRNINGHISHPENETLRAALNAAYPEESHADRLNVLSGRGNQTESRQSATSARPVVHTATNSTPSRGNGTPR